MLDGGAPLPQYPSVAQPMQLVEYLHYPGIRAPSEEQSAQVPMSSAGSVALPQSKRPRTDVRTGHGVHSPQDP